MSATLLLIAVLLISALSPLLGADSRSKQPNRPINYPG